MHAVKSGVDKPCAFPLDCLLTMPNQYSHLSPKDRFLNLVEKTDDCWNWIGCLNAGGYGYTSICKGKKKVRNIVAHRRAYELFVGPIPDDFLVLHKCDNPPCVNPNHLFIGTQKDNVADMFRKGRQKNGPNSISATARALKRLI